MNVKQLILALFFLIIILGLVYTSTIKEEVIEEEPAEYIPQDYTVTEDSNNKVSEEVEIVTGKEDVVISDVPPTIKTISIVKNAFTPKTVNVRSGTIITWVNEDENVHQIKAITPANEFRSLRLNPGESYSITLDEEGEYKYIDTIHTFMQGKIIVDDNALTSITGNFVLGAGNFTSSPANFITLLLFLALGITFIYTIHPKDE